MNTSKDLRLLHLIEECWIEKMSEIRAGAKPKAKVVPDVRNKRREGSRPSPRPSSHSELLPDFLRFGDSNLQHRHVPRSCFSTDSR